MNEDHLEKAEDVDKEERGDPILRSEFDRALKNLNLQKAVGVDEMPAELLCSLRNIWFNRLFKLTSRIYESGEVPSDFNKSIIVSIPNKAQADKLGLSYY
ncbi:MAG: hypothetical protein ACEY3F_05470 [Wolbachia sp.]